MVHKTAPLDLFVMSFNIRTAEAQDGSNGWNFRKPLVISFLKATTPDIAGLQEAHYHQLEDLVQAIPEYGKIGVGRDDGDRRGEHSAILYIREKFEVLASGTFWFSETPHIAGSKHWGNKMPRICTWAHLQDNTTKQTVAVYNLHLDHRSKKARFNSVHLLGKMISSKNPENYPVVITGDFNAGPYSKVVRYITKQPRNSRTHSFIDTHASNNSSKFASSVNFFWRAIPGIKIDFIFAPSSCSVLRSEIIAHKFKKRFLSDHFPVSATIRFPAQTSICSDTINVETINKSYQTIEVIPKLSNEFCNYLIKFQ